MMPMSAMMPEIGFGELNGEEGPPMPADGSVGENSDGMDEAPHKDAEHDVDGERGRVMISTS